MIHKTNEMNLNEIDAVMESIRSELKNVVGTLEFQTISEFQINTAKKEIEWDRLDHQGLYLIEIKTSSEYSSFENWLDDFLPRWEHDKYRSKATPNSKKKRKAFHRKKELKEWVPLYLGKSKKIKDRIWGHIYSKLQKPTAALKLMERSNMHLETFRLRTVQIGIREENYDFIVPYLEKKLREVKQPILGRQ